MVRYAHGGRHPVRPCPDPQPGHQASASGRAWPSRRDRSPRRRPSASDPGGGTLLADPAGNTPGRPWLRRAHRGGVGGDWLFGGRNRTTAFGEQPMIDFYYWPTPNGWKVAIMLEEC